MVLPLISLQKRIFLIWSTLQGLIHIAQVILMTYLVRFTDVLGNTYGDWIFCGELYRKLNIAGKGTLVESRLSKIYLDMFSDLQMVKGRKFKYIGSKMWHMFLLNLKLNKNDSVMIWVGNLKSIENAIRFNEQHAIVEVVSDLKSKRIFEDNLPVLGLWRRYRKSGKKFEWGNCRGSAKGEISAWHLSGISYCNFWPRIWRT